MNFNRYLKILAVTAKKPDLDTLKKIVKAHVIAIPFENISKLYYKKSMDFSGLPKFNQYIDGIESYNFGGTCYSNNYYLYLLLEYLGYDVKLCGADMDNPDVHMVSMVKVAGREYLVDTGYGAPFFLPLQRELSKDHVINYGSESYILKPQDKNGSSRLELYRNGTLKHSYLAKPEAKKIGDFRQVITNSFRKEATFMNAVALFRFFPDRSFVIRNLTLIKTTGSETKIYTLSNREKLTGVIEELFNIPREIVTEAISELGALKDAWD